MMIHRQFLTIMMIILDFEFVPIGGPQYGPQHALLVLRVLRAGGM